VKTCDHHHRVSDEPIKQLVWESMKQETTRITVDHSIREWCFLNHAFAPSELRQKLITIPVR
jgi:hypothetical protein